MPSEGTERFGAVREAAASWVATRTQPGVSTSGYMCETYPFVHFAHQALNFADIMSPGECVLRDHVRLLSMVVPYAAQSSVLSAHLNRMQRLCRKSWPNSQLQNLVKRGELEARLVDDVWRGGGS